MNVCSTSPYLSFLNVYLFPASIIICSFILSGLCRGCFGFPDSIYHSKAPELEPALSARDVVNILCSLWMSTGLCSSVASALRKSPRPALELVTANYKGKKRPGKDQLPTWPVKTNLSTINFFLCLLSFPVNNIIATFRIQIPNLQNHFSVLNF